MSVRAPVGEISKAMFPCCLGRGVCSITFDNDYLYHYLVFIEKDWIKYSTGSTFDSVNSKQIYETTIAIPDTKEEQKVIASTLTDIDNLIDALDKTIDKKKNIKQGAMQELLTGKKRLEGFSGEWVEKRLGEIGKTYGGMSGKSKVHFGKGNAMYIPFMNILSNPIIDITYLEKVIIGENEQQNKAKIGDVFFNTSSETPEEVGICSVLLNDVDNLYLNSFCFGFRLNDKEVSGLYLSYFFRSQCGRKLMYALAQGATRYNLSKSLFNQLMITIPKSIKEQNAIVTLLRDMDNEINALENKRGKYVMVKYGMMDELLTGRTRLI